MTWACFAYPTNQPNGLFRAPLIGGAKNEVNQTNFKKKNFFFFFQRRKKKTIVF